MNQIPFEVDICVLRWTLQESIRDLNIFNVKPPIFFFFFFTTTPSLFMSSRFLPPAHTPNAHAFT